MKSNPGDLAWYFIFFNSLAAIGILVFSGNQALAQVTPDNTLGDENSVVNTRDATSDSIEGGAIREQNLFHSFSEFNVDAVRGVYFANPDDVNNIFSRVTGNNVSNILGTLGVDGAANLFLINPNGIIFGEGASLDVQGSFAATTADGIEFGEQGFFSASDPQAPKLLTINPSAYLFNQVAPGAIVSNYTANNDLGLQVQPEKSLSLIGGDITLDRGLITAPGAKVELGGLSETGSVKILENGSLSFPDGVARSDVFLSNGASVNVSGNEGGSIFINANNLELLDASSLVGGIASGLGTFNAQAGDIILDTTGDIDLTEASKVQNIVEENAIGDAGKVNIQTNFLTLDYGSAIGARTLGNGNGGDVTINASDSISNSGGVISSSIIENAVGNAGDISITTQNLNLTNGGEIVANTFGQGDAGNITINATGNISADGEDSSGLVSGVFSQVTPTAQGNSGEINITTGNLTLTNQGLINTVTFGRGNAGKIIVNANDTISIDGDNFQKPDTQTGIGSEVQDTGIGNGGEINIDAGKLILTNGGEITSSTFGQGDAGKITINVSDTILADGEDSDGFNSGVFSQVTPTAKGNSGDIKITTGNLTLTDQGVIDTATFSRGNAGKIIIDANDTISIDGNNFQEFGTQTGIGSQVQNTGIGNGGEININAGKLILTNGGEITSSTFGEGDSGNLSITADNSISLDASSNIVNSVDDINAVGDGGKIEITTGSLSATNGSQINSFTRGQGNAGDITIQARDTIAFDGFGSDGLPSGLNTTVEVGGAGDGGDISLTSGDIHLRSDSDIRTNVFNSTGDGGNINIAADAVIAFDDSDIFAFAADGQGGNITLNTPAYFAENFTLNSLTSNPDSLDKNSRADLNATGAVSGTVTIPDVSFIQNGLTNLPDNSINTNELVANSCVSPAGNRQQGKFIITGKGGLPARPGNGDISDFSTGEVRNVPSNKPGWQRGEPIIEPQGIYRLANGKLVMSRECNK
jgi:filamentous hemagglutinin family protein